MQKLWRWLQEKKSNTVRKWRSSILSDRRANSGFDPFDDRKLFADDYVGLERRPIGGSEGRIGAKRSALQRIQRKLTPSKRLRPPDFLSPGNDEPGPSNSTESDEIRELLLDDEDIYNSRNSLNNAAGYSPALSQASNDAAALPPLLRKRGFSYSVGKSNTDSPDLNTAVTPKTRRRLRFVIPQVSLSSVENPNGESTLLVGDSVDSLDELDPNQRERASLLSVEGSNARSLYSPGSARRVLSDKRLSIAQRRQSNHQIKLVQSVSGRRTSTTLVPLTQAQIHLVRSLWKQIYTSKGPTVIGETVMQRLFFKSPKLKDQFRKCPLPDHIPNHDMFAKFHYKCMGELVDQVVESLDNLEVVGEELERIGRIHASVLNGQLSTKIWNAVAETFIDCTLEWGDRRCRSETVRKAWALIIAYMTEKLKHGHLDQRKQMLTMKSTIASLERFAMSRPS